MREHETAVIMGDTHIGWERSNLEGFREFINEGIYEIDPDVFIVNGDMLELWRSSFSVLVVKYSDIFTSLSEVAESGIEVVLTAGNHDWRMIDADSIETGDLKELHYVEHYRFSSGEEEFIATHGHEADSSARSRIQNALFCISSDEAGEFMANTWNKLQDTRIAEFFQNREPIVGQRSSFINEGPLVSRPSIRAFSYVAEPGTLALDKNSARYERVIEITQRLYDETVIGAHTHEKDERDGYYNPGGWIDDRTGYVYIENGEVTIEDY